MSNLAYDYSWIPDPPPRAFKLMPGEVAVLRAALDETASEWAQGERQVHISPLPGAWDNDTTPYAASIMDLYSQEWLRELYVAGGSQTAKTDISHNCWGWVATHDPGPALIGMQDRTTGTEIMSDRFIPMVKDTPSLRRLVSKNADDISQTRISLKNGMKTYLAWGNSEGRAASKPIRYLFLSEVDLYPPLMIKKLRARTGAYEGMFKVLEECTVSIESGRIWSVQHQVQARYRFEVPCPHCGEYQVMDPANIQWKDGVVEPSGLIHDVDAWYLCLHNNCKWDDFDRDEAVKQHRLVSMEGSVEERPESVWIHLSPLLSPFNTFRKIAKAYLTTLIQPTEENLIYYYCDCCGLPLPEDSEGELTGEKELYERRNNYGPDGVEWQVPMEACVVTADADIQKNRIEVESVAWGEGEQGWGLEYRVFHGDTSEDGVWDQLHDWAQDTRYQHESGVDLQIVRLGVDIGYRADRVAKFVRRSRRYIAHKGSSTRGLPLVPRMPSKSRKYKVPFYELGTEAGKDLLFSWLTVVNAGPRCCHWHNGYDFEYFRMLCAEQPKREKNRKTGKIETFWVLRDGYQRNESLDIRVGNIAVREILNPNYKKLAENLRAQQRQILDAAHVKTKQTAETDHQENTAGPRHRPSWRK
jgi:phage terminase large subunit GpA-like protein